MSRTVFSVRNRYYVKIRKNNASVSDDSDSNKSNFNEDVYISSSNSDGVTE